MSEVVTEKSWAITPVGVGRKDYSQNVEQSVEPLIRSYQDNYDVWDDPTIPGGGSFQQVYTLPEDEIVMFYTFRLSVPKNILVRLAIEVYYEGAYHDFLDKSMYQTVEHRLPRGADLADRFRMTAYNYDLADTTSRFSAIGIRMTKEQYYAQLF